MITDDIHSLSASDIAAIGAVIIGIIGAFGTIVVNIIVSLRTQKEVRDVADKTNNIAASVDGASTAAAAREEALRKELALLRENMADRQRSSEKRETAALAAFAGTVSTPTATSTPANVIIKNPEPIPVVPVDPI